MKKEKADFAIESKDNTVAKIGRSSVLMPKVNFGGGKIKWYKDKLKKVHKQVS